MEEKIKINKKQEIFLKILQNTLGIAYLFRKESDELMLGINKFIGLDFVCVSEIEEIVGRFNFVTYEDGDIWIISDILKESEVAE